tara:strand:+ start:9927 stop:12941 length:3015 start_codon:yes stop_codon:yes gene_type:complete
MAERKFRFASPGVFIEEIDQSQVPRLPEAVGPTIIGRTEKGPGLQPVKVTSFNDFVETFGEPIAGVGGTEDGWREGNYAAPTYAAYAAQAYLAAGVGPVNIVRLVGAQDPNATTAGKAGWDTTNTLNAGAASNGGAYGLFIINSASYSSSADGAESDPGFGVNPHTGSLAAIFYIDQGAVRLSGTVAMANDDPTANPITASAATMIVSETDGAFVVEVLDESENIVEKKTVNLDRNSDRFIRKAFNTNPQMVNSTITDTVNLKKYWLGETFERAVEEKVTTTTKFGFIASLSDASYDRADMRGATIDAYTGWFFSQDAAGQADSYDPTVQTRLFKFAGINNYGEWLNTNVKIGISDIKGPRSKESDYGTFTVDVRRAYDTDANPIFIERYTNCNLNPASPDYIAAKIGDQYTTWDNDKKLYRTYGQYENKSKYIRLVLNPNIEALMQDTPNLVPFGILGPPKFRDFRVASGSVVVYLANVTGNAGGGAGEQHPQPFVRAGTTIPYGPAQDEGDTFIDWRHGGATGSFAFPSPATRVSASDGRASVKSAYFGLDSGISNSDPSFDPGYGDYLRALPVSLYSNTDTVDFNKGGANNAYLDFSWAVSLDDLVVTTSSAGLVESAYWRSGSRARYDSFTSLSGGAPGAGASTAAGLAGGNWEQLLDKGLGRLLSPLYGGFDGLDITEAEPFRNTKLSTESETTNYAFYTVKRAIDTVADKERLATNLITIPGVTNESLTSRLINTCEARGDSLAIIDLKGTHQPSSESTATEDARKSNLDTTISNLVDRRINSSYGCAYYPWVDIRDPLKSVRVRVPPSVVALGVFASTERSNDLWFAPAGFNRGGLSEGKAGLPVVGVEQRLTSEDRDKLYERNINPIASFPSEGVVIFGQKTLQVTPSALDRINVRRMLIFLKHEVTRIANSILFDPNITVTWDRFRSQTERLLKNVQSRFGITDYRVILDESTTTPDLIDRNILYAKVLVKPARAIEFIAIDFVITRTAQNLDEL